MKRVMIVLLLASVAMGLAAQQQQESFSVGIWAFVPSNEDYADRLYNELTKQLEASTEWDFEVEHEDPWNADIHLLVSGMKHGQHDSYAWGVTYTPIFTPRYTNGNVGITENNYSGVNWIARRTVVFVENELYYWYDDQVELNP